jgi:toxin-antitoxin system PIN domain toxin
MMILCDVNVLILAARRDTQDHQRYAAWLHDAVNSDQAYGVTDIVLSAFLRIVTNPRAFREPTPLEDAIEFLTRLREPANCMAIQPGPRHWRIFLDLCRRANARGNLVPDAYLAALAIESGSEWITTDRDYARFPGLRWRHPLEA